MNSKEPIIRAATEQDLNAINEVIVSAVMSWPLAHRVKRLSLMTLRYDAQDLLHFDMYVVQAQKGIVGVASWDPDHPFALFHGLYIDPEHQGKGLGKTLMAHVFSSARGLGKGSMLIRAERVSASYFRQPEFEPVEVGEDEYPYQFRKLL